MKKSKVCPALTTDACDEVGREAWRGLRDAEGFPGRCDERWVVEEGWGGHHGVKRDCNHREHPPLDEAARVQHRDVGVLVRKRRCLVQHLRWRVAGA